MRPRAAAAVLATALAAAPAAKAQESGAGPALTLRTSLKGSILLTRAPDDPELFPQRDSATTLWRIRFEPSIRPTPSLTVTIAYEQRLRFASAPAGFQSAAALPSEAPAPYRIRQLDWTLSDGARSSWRHEVDRALVAWRLPKAEITAGRQAIGWGRGVMFGAVDLFAPFSPVEADREWRRGVDAVRADVRLAARVSLDTVGAFGRTIDTSVFAARLRGYAGRADVEVVGGRRARDDFGGLTASAAVGDTELHGETAVFRTPERGTVVKAVAGGSYRLPIGTGVLVFGEYQYSGFGATSAAAILPLLADPAFQERYLRGDTQTLGRHAVGVLLTSEWSPSLSLGGQWLHNPVDGSGIVVPSATFVLGDRLSILANVYLAYGRRPEGWQLATEYGAGGMSGFLQVRFYN
ncbi:MAG: hypothetical protein ACM3SQ_18150 [Betaproteobacteria bacterium]